MRRWPAARDRVRGCGIIRPHRAQCCNLITLIYEEGALLVKKINTLIVASTSVKMQWSYFPDIFSLSDTAFTVSVSFLNDSGVIKCLQTASPDSRTLSTSWHFNYTFLEEGCDILFNMKGPLWFLKTWHSLIVNLILNRYDESKCLCRSMSPWSQTVLLCCCFSLVDIVSAGSKLHMNKCRLAWLTSSNSSVCIKPNLPFYSLYNIRTARRE